MINFCHAPVKSAQTPTPRWPSAITAARRYFERAIDLHDLPGKITLDKRGANTDAMRSLVIDSGAAIEGKSAGP
jgi:transposase-like protein